MLRILYGVNGEGMGHATRAHVVIERLLERHDVRVVASGTAFRYLRERLPRVDEIFGPSFALDQGEIRRWATVRHNVATAPREAPATVRHWLGVVHAWQPDVVVTDFEPLAGMYARTARVPLVSVDNIHMVDRCQHDDGIVGDAHADFAIARAVTRAMVPTAGDYVITTFFRPPVCRGRTTLVPPIVRPEVAAAEPEAGDHLLVYSGGSEALLDVLRAAGVPARVYGMRPEGDDGEREGTIEHRPRSVAGFLEDLRTARAVVTGGGFSLLSEAIALRKPVLSVPLHGQFEQLMNARYLHREGYGMCAETVDAEVMAAFLRSLPRYARRLAARDGAGNEAALDVVEETVVAAAADDRLRRRELRRLARRSVA
jgi:uncharacterized protein (TIGR00661 family)